VTKHLREVTRLARTYGLRVETARSGHLRIVRRNGSYVTSASSSPSCASHALRNLERTIKRGLVA
jgi:hypothetical protein